MHSSGRYRPTLISHEARKWTPASSAASIWFSSTTPSSPDISITKNSTMHLSHYFSITFLAEAWLLKPRHFHSYKTANPSSFEPSAHNRDPARSGGSLRLQVSSPPKGGIPRDQEAFIRLQISSSPKVGVNG